MYLIVLSLQAASMQDGLGKLSAFFPYFEHFAKHKYRKLNVMSNDNYTYIDDNYIL